MPNKIIPFNVAIKSTSPRRSYDIPKAYTNDLNSVEFQFTITDMTAEELTTAKANVLLYMLDGSFFENNEESGVTIEGNVVTYTMKSNEGNHSGVNEAQVEIIYEGAPDKKLASQKYEFEIINGLDMEVAVEIVVKDWSALTTEARKFIDDSTVEVNALKTELQNSIDTANTSLGEFDVALETGIVAANLAEKLEDFESTNNSRLLSAEQQLAQVTHFVYPTGTADDTAMLNAAVLNNARVTLTPGVYNIDASVGFLPKSNRDIIFQRGAILKAIPNALQTYSIIRMDSVNDVTITEPYVVGDKDDHIGTLGEWGSGILFSGVCTNIKIVNPYIEKCWGDGIYIAQLNNSAILNPVIDGCRRNGIAVISCSTLLISNPEVRNTIGIAPEAGIDLEPNLANEVIKDLTIENPYLHHNNGRGLDVLGKTNNPAQWQNVVIKNIVSRYNGGGMRFESGGNIIATIGKLNDNTGYGLELAKDIRGIRFADFDIFNNGKRGIGGTLTSQTVSSGDWLFENCKIYNNGQTAANTYDGVRVDSNDIAYPLIGVRFINCDIFDDQAVKTQRYGLTVGTETVVKGFVFTGSIKAGLTGTFLTNPQSYVETGKLKFSVSVDIQEVPPNSRTYVDITNSAVISGSAVVARPDSDVENGIMWNAIARTGFIRLYIANVQTISVDPAPRTWHFSITSN